MKTLMEVLRLSTEYLKQKGIVNPRRQAEDLIGDALGLTRIEVYTDFERPCTEGELAVIRSRLSRRGKGEPIQYIHGEMMFRDCLLKITPEVLIPRQETELLVDRISKELENQSLEGKVLWDICTGSGCIGIALKKRFPSLKVVLSDISPKAIEVAKNNAKANEVEVECRVGDLLSPFSEEKADFLISNPPYIPEKDFLKLDVEVKDHEPTIALIGGKTGLEFYERLSREMPLFLQPKAKIWFEIGHDQGEAIKRLFESAPWKSARVDQDWSGHDRFFSLEIE